MAMDLPAKPRTPEERRVWSWAMIEVRRGRVSGDGLGRGVPLPPWVLPQVLVGARPAEGGGDGDGDLFFLIPIFE